MTTLLLVAGLTLLASFLCSLFEAALYAVTPSQVEVLKQEGRSGSARLARLREDVEAPIAAILTVNTVAHTAGAAWCGALVAEIYGSAAVGVFAAIFTVLVLALTEIVPKSLGVRHAIRLAPLIVWPLQVMIWSTWPVVWVARHAMKWLGGDAPAGPSEDEIEVLARLAARGGTVRPEEHEWVANALRLDTVKAADLRTPRTVVETIPADTLVSEVDVPGLVHSRLPVTDGDDPDKVLGLVLRRDLLDAVLERPDAGLIVRDLMLPMRFVPESLAAHALLEHFIADRSHMIGLADEYGGFEGVVCLEDVLECLLGQQIVDEHDQVEDMQALALARRDERRGATGATRGAGTQGGDGATGEDGENGAAEASDEPEGAAPGDDGSGTVS